MRLLSSLLLPSYFRSLCFFLFVSFSLFLSSALAEVHRAPRSVCALYYTGKRGTVVRCTGALISPKIVVTTSSCIPDDPSEIKSKVFVGCGFVSDSPFGAAFGASSQFQEEFYVTGVQISQPSGFSLDLLEEAGADFAFLRLDHSAHMEPMYTASKFSEFKSMFLTMSSFNASSAEYEIKMNTPCFSTSFVYEDTRKTYSPKSSDRTPDSSLKAYARETTRALLLASFGRPFPRPQIGESGGVLYCKSKSGDWTLAGIASINTSDKWTLGRELYAGTYSKQFLFFLDQLKKRWSE